MKNFHDLWKNIEANRIFSCNFSIPRVPVVVCDGSGRAADLLSFTHQVIRDDGYVFFERFWNSLAKFLLNFPMILVLLLSKILCTYTKSNALEHLFTFLYKNVEIFILDILSKKKL